VELDRDECIKIKNVRCYAETGKAILVKINGEKHWMPLSQIHEDSEVFSIGDTGSLIVSTWILEQKGIEL